MAGPWEKFAPEAADGPWSKFAPEPAAPGPLDKTGEEGELSGLAKGTATAVVKGLANIPGVYGNLGNLADYLFARGHSAISGKPVEQVLQEMAAIDAERKKTVLGRASTAISPRNFDGEFFAKPVLGVTGEYTPESDLGKMGQVGLETAISVFGPGTGAAKIIPKGAPMPPVGGGGPGVVSSLMGEAASTARLAPLNMAAGAAGEGATQITGDPLIGMLAGTAVPVGLSAAADAAGRFTAPMRAGQRQRLADEKLMTAASDPEKALADLSFQPAEIVPGSKPTSGELSGDIGLLQAENRAKTEIPSFEAAIKVKEGEQNVARRAAINEMAPDGADQLAVSRLFQRQLADLDKTTESAVQRLAQSTDLLNSRISGAKAPEEVGGRLRDALQGAYDAARDVRRKLYDAVDPNGELTVIAKPARERADELASQMDPLSKPVAGEEAAILEAVRGLPEVVPFNSLRELDSRITDAMSQERRSAGQSKTWGRLSQLKSAVAGAINDAIDNQAKYEAEAVKAQRMAYEDTIDGRLRAGLEEPVSVTTARLSGYPEDRGGSASFEAGLPAGNDRTASPIPERSGSVEGGQSLPPTSRIPDDLRDATRPPQTLISYIRSLGGIRDEGGELAARDYNRQYPGLVNNRSGISLDRAREAAAEQGYLGADNAGAMSGTSVAQFLDVLDNHPHYSQWDVDQQIRHSEYLDWKGEKSKYRNAVAELEREFDNYNADMGVTAEPLRREISREAAVEMVDNNLSWDEALERVAIRHTNERAENAIQREAARRESRRTQEDARNYEGPGRSRRDGRGYPDERDAGPAREPQFDSEAGLRLQKAKEAHKELVQTYRQGLVGESLRTLGFDGQYRVPDAGVVGKAFAAGDRGYQSAKAFIDAGKGDAVVVDAIKDAAINRLRDAMKGDRLTPKALEGWQRKYGQALRAIDEVEPGFSKQFENAAKATDILTQAEGARVQAIKDFQSGAAAKFIGLTDASEVQAQIGTMLRAKDGPKQIKALVQRVASEPAALEGLRRAGVETIRSRNTNAGMAGGEPVLSGAKLRKDLDANSASLEALYGREGMANMRRVAADLERSQAAYDAVKVAGSPTARNQKPILERLFGKAASDTSVGAAFLLAGWQAWQQMGVGAAIGVAGAAAAKNAIAKLRAAGLDKVDQLYTEGLLNPEVGRAMLARAMENGKPNVNAVSKLATAVTRSANVGANVEGNERRRNEPRKGFAEGGKVTVEDGPVLRDYEAMGAPDWVPSREAREVALDFEGNPDAQLQEVIKLYGLDQRTSPYKPDELYRRLAGEVEARNVQKRMDMTPEQRRATPPWLTQDVPDEQQIVRGVLSNYARGGRVKRRMGS